jgi:hypothetical protein
MCCRTALAERPSLCPISAGGIRLLTNSVSSRSSADDQRVCGPRAVRRSSLASRFGILSDEAATSCLRAVLATLRRRAAPPDLLRERVLTASERPEVTERLGIVVSRCSRVGSHSLQRRSWAEVPTKRDSAPLTNFEVAANVMHAGNIIRNLDGAPLLLSAESRDAVTICV